MMPYAEFVLRLRAAAQRQLLAIEAVVISHPSDDVARRMRLADLQEIVDG
jgi:hypothetical protein